MDYDDIEVDTIMRITEILKNKHGYMRRKDTNFVQHPIVYSYGNGIIQDMRRNNIIETELHTADKVFKDLSALDWVECDKFGNIL